MHAEMGRFVCQGSAGAGAEARKGSRNCESRASSFRLKFLSIRKFEKVTAGQRQLHDLNYTIPTHSKSTFAPTRSILH